MTKLYDIQARNNKLICHIVINSNQTLQSISIIILMTFQKINFIVIIRKSNKMEDKIFYNEFIDTILFKKTVYVHYRQFKINGSMNYIFK